MLLLIASVFVLPGAANGQPQYFKGQSGSPPGEPAL